MSGRRRPRSGRPIARKSKKNSVGPRCWMSPRDRLGTCPDDLRKGHDGLLARYVAPSGAGIDWFEGSRIVGERITGSFDQSCHPHSAVCR